MKKIYFGLLVICVLPAVATARQNVLNGSLSVSEDFDSNRYETEDDRVDLWQTTVAPAFSFLSSGAHDTVDFTYEPEFIYDHQRDTNDNTHDLAFTVDRQLSSRWSVSFNDSFSYSDYDEIDMGPPGDMVAQFIRADGYVRDEVVRILFPELGEYDPDTDYTYVLSELEERYAYAAPQRQARVDNLLSPADPGRRRHYTNETSLDFSYEFGADRLLSFGYTLITLNDKSSGMAEYTEHNPHLSLAWRFSQQWSFDFSYDLNIMDYDDVEDESTQSTEFRLNYNLNPHDLLYWSYDFSYTDYDDELAGNFYTQDYGIGWEHDFGSLTRLTTYLGGSYEQRDVSGDERGYEANVNLTREFQRGNYHVGCEGGYDEYSGSRGWDDLREYLTINAGLNYEMSQDISLDTEFVYERNISWDRTEAHEKITDNDYDAGVGVTYTFLRWYSVSLRYAYHVLNTDALVRDDYYDHQVFLEFSGARDIFHW